MENNKTAAVFLQMAKWQIAATSAVALGAFILSGLHGAVSAILGGGSAVLGGLAGSILVLQNEKNKTAGAVLVGLLKAEAVKILVIGVLLLVSFKFYANNLVPLALIIGLGVAAILSGAAIFGIDKNSNI